MSEESNKIESLLFSSGRKMREDELVQLTHLKLSQVKSALEELKQKYGEENTSLMLFSEGDTWKLTVREKYLGVVQNIVSQTELDKSVMETLAVIAWKYPILQADVIKIRNNKAYDHMAQLEEMGFVIRERQGRTRSIKLTQKFFDYFDLPKGDQTRETFRKVVPEEIREAIERRETEIKEAEGKIEEGKAKKEGMEQQMRDEKEREKNIDKEIDLMDENDHKIALNTYEIKPEELEEEKKKDRETRAKLQGFEIITEEKEDMQRQTSKEQKAEQIVANIEKEKTTPAVEKRIQELLHPSKKKDEFEREMEGTVGEEETEEDQTQENPEEETKSEFKTD